jgi:chromosomal replication initiator protein
MSAPNLWDLVLGRVEAKVNRHSFYTWFKPTAFVREAGDGLVVLVPNGLFSDWLLKHYAGVISEALAELGRSQVEVSFVTDEPGAAPLQPIEPGVEAEDEEGDMALASSPLGLHPRYTFDTFVVGPSNQFAHAACRAVAEAPSRSYNPLFIYGGVGLGKTHLMHAIGHYVLRQSPSLKVTYISAERFMNEMINAIRYERILDFRDRYRSVDLLLVDDIQFIGGKESTQTEFFHT